MRISDWSSYVCSSDLLDIDVLERLSVDDGHAQFFCLRRVDQHASHVRSLRARPVLGRHAKRLGVSPGEFLPGPRMPRPEPGLPTLLHHCRPGVALFNRSRAPRTAPLSRGWAWRYLTTDG